MELSHLAASQAGVFARDQARRAGYSPRRTRRRLDRGDWVVVTAHVYTQASTVLGTDSWLWAGYLAAGKGAVVSHLSAGRLHGLGVASQVPWITVAPGRRMALEGVRLVRAHVGRGEVDAAGGMLVTSRGRTIVDCLCVLRFGAALELMDRALQRRWTSVADLAAGSRRRFGRPGAPQLRRLLRHATCDARFEAERRLHTLLRRAGIGGWKANAEIRDAPGELVAVADVLFEKYRLVIEVDGRAWHSSGERFQHDRTRQNALVAMGYVVLRFTWYDVVRRPEYVVGSVRGLVTHLSPRS